MKSQWSSLCVLQACFIAWANHQIQQLNEAKWNYYNTSCLQVEKSRRNQGDSSLNFHFTAWSRSLSLCRQWQKNSPRSLSVPKCGFITSNDFSTRQSLHWPEVGLNGLALVTRAQLMVKSVSSTIPLSLRLQMYLERQVRPRYIYI